jgi:probable phosphoglycerate mutase
VRAWLSADAGEARMPGGETLGEVQERAWQAIERMRLAHPHAEVVAVAHNFVILTVVCRALNLPLSEFRRLRHGLASRTVVDMLDGGATLIHLNDNAHLLAAGLSGDPT